METNDDFNYCYYYTVVHYRSITLIYQLILVIALSPFPLLQYAICIRLVSTIEIRILVYMCGLCYGILYDKTML